MKIREREAGGEVRKIYSVRGNDMERFAASSFATSIHWLLWRNFDSSAACVFHLRLGRSKHARKCTVIRKQEPSDHCRDCNDDAQRAVGVEKAQSSFIDSLVFTICKNGLIRTGWDLILLRLN